MLMNSAVSSDYDSQAQFTHVDPLISYDTSEKQSSKT